MILKGTGATTHIDRHNCKITKEALEDIVKDVNEGVYAIGVGIEHDSTIMPIGKVINGKIVKLDDGEYEAQIEQEIFEEYQIFNDKTNTKWYITQSKIDNRPFADTQIEEISNIIISVDPVNFSQSDLEDLLEFYKKECLFDTEYLMRKSVIPTPIIVFKLAKGMMERIAGKTVDKVSDKLSDQLSDDSVVIYNSIKKSVLRTIKYLKKENRPITYIVKEYNAYAMELVVITENPEILLSALANEKMCQVYAKIDEFIEIFDIDIAKLQCIYDTEENQWRVNYVTTRDGKVIGSEKCYKKTVELKKRAGTGLSIGGTQDIVGV